MTNSGGNASPDRWWLVALAAAGVVFVTALLALFFPTSRFVWALGAAEVVYVVVTYFHPSGWLKRTATSCLGVGAAMLALPSLKLLVDVKDLGSVQWIIDNSPLLGTAFVIAAMFLVWLDHRRSLPTTPISSGVQQNFVSSGTAIAHADHVQTGVDNLTVQLMLDFADKQSGRVVDVLNWQMSEKDQQLSEKEGELRDLRAALARLHEQADRGDIKAQAALDEARRTGDPSQLQSVLVATADQLNRQIVGQTTEYIALCREIAAVAFLRGDIDEAFRRLNVILKAIPIDRDAINRLGHIQHLRGQLAEAEQSYQRVIELSSDNESWQAVGCGNLGLIYETRGEVDRAEEMHRKSLAIHEKLSRQEGMAIQYSNLGLIYRTRGELDRAEEMHRKSLAIEKELGRQEGMASEYGKLGLIYRTRGELDRAEEMHRKALAVDEKLGHQEGMASDYGNLGVIYAMRDELDRAEEMLRKSLAIHEKLGLQEGIASNFAGLGLVYAQRNELDKAEEMHLKGLAIEEKLGRQKEMANQCGNIGTVAKKRGDTKRARELWVKARDLFAKVGMPHEVQKIQAALDGLLSDKVEDNGVDK